MKKFSIVPIFVPHLGCPNDCVFCNQRAISGQVYQTTPQEVDIILQNARDCINNEFEVAFYGGSFTAICESLQNQLLDVALKYTDNIRISTRPDCIDDQILLRLKSKGVKTIELGSQSMCDEVLLASKRGHTANDTILASMLIKQHGFILGLQTMVGMPQDTYEKLIYTTNEVIKLKPDFVRIYPIVVVRDTELFDMYQSGQYTPLTISDAVELCADVLQMYNEACITVIRVGLNPSEDLSRSTAVAGAYHPAFGQLVASEIFYKKMVDLIKDTKKQEVVFYVNKRDISTAIGQKRINMEKLYNEYKIKARIKEGLVEKNNIILGDV